MKRAQSRTRSRLIGVTGGIGAGKSEVCRVFGSLGAAVLNADRIAIDIVRTDAAVRRRLTRLLGPAAFDSRGRYDRKAVARLVFEDRTLLRGLNRIIHPAVTRKILSLASRRISISAAGRCVVVEAALIYEAGIEGIFDAVVAVEAPKETRIRRILSRDGTTRAAVLRRMASQLPPREVSSRSDFVIRNGGGRRGLVSACRLVLTLVCSDDRGSKPRRRAPRSVR